MRIAVSLKAVVLFGLVVALPLLALPVAVRLIDSRLNSEPPADLAAEPLVSGTEEVVALPMVVERVSPAELTEPGAQRAAGGLDAAGAAPLAPAAAFDPLWTAATPSAPVDEEVQIDEATIARLQQVRQRLQELGADYVIVEATEFGGRFRFHCRMLVEAHSRFTRPFEAVSADPLAAGEQVLREVEAWRLAANDRRRRQE